MTPFNILKVSNEFKTIARINMGQALINTDAEKITRRLAEKTLS